jgi:hypothetical protein
MERSAYFDAYWGNGWPEPKAIEHYFVGRRPAKRWLFETDNDSANLSLKGVEGTEHLEFNKGRIDIRLDMWGHPEHGVLLIYWKWGGRYKDTFYSKSNLSRLREWVISLHGDPLPVGLFIPYERAWIAVKAFLESDGMRSSGIEWIADRDLPPNTFPDRFNIPTS